MPIESPPPKPTKRPRIRGIAIEVGIAIVIVVAMSWWRTRDAVHGAAPTLPPITVNAPTQQVTNEPTLVYFWATWCGVCSTMKGTIDGLAKDHRVVTIASESGGAEAVRKYLDSSGIAYPTVLDDGGGLARTWKVAAFPTMYVIDRAGQVRFVEVGWTSSIGLRLRLWWAGL